MNKYYFTYGTSSCMPYQGGWSLIYAEDIDEARDLHRDRHGLSENGLLRYAFDYTEEEFLKSGMVDGNLGAKEQERLSSYDYLYEAVFDE